MGVNETGDKFDYGFKLKQVSIEPFLPSWVTWLKQTVNNQDFDASGSYLYFLFYFTGWQLLPWATLSLYWLH
jgi:hypothetical protein